MSSTFYQEPEECLLSVAGYSYPNIEDAERGLRTGLITRAQHDQIVGAIKEKPVRSYTPLGGLIYIHGTERGVIDRGGVALENEDIKELYDSVDKGTPVYD